MRKRLRVALLAIPVALLATLAIAGTASAAHPDPQTANIPYLAWAGNQVRVAKCFDSRQAENDVESATRGIDLSSILYRGKFVVEDWSGTELTGPFAGIASKEPQFLNSNDGDVVPRVVDGRLCFAVHVSSLKPGLAVIKLAVRQDLLGLFPGLDVLAKHQFLVIWLRSQAPVIREVANGDFPDLDLGDPTGDGIFNPLFKNGLVQINVSGTFPLGNNFSGNDPDDSITLPRDWAQLAAMYSFDDDRADGGRPGSAVDRWDIHDDKLPTEGHVLSSGCPDASAAVVIEAVDNCYLGTGGDQNGPFSSIYGMSTGLGPFDPLVRLTLLSDGKTDADDAPMPPLRVDVRLAAGSAGGLEKADKDDIYVRDQSIPDGRPHNLYAPYYRALIPASLPIDDGTTSGVAGSFTNNFPGFLDADGRYDYWALALRRTEDPLRGNRLCKDELGDYRTSPTGFDHVAVYTDEHGEAFVSFNPNTGFNFEVDSNFRCDLDDPDNRSFDSEITAEGLYPDQPVIWDQASKVSNTLTKTVNIAASKTLVCVPKGTNESFCVETILDIQGRPVAGALVRFSRTPLGNIEPDAALHGGFDTRGQTLVNNNGPLWVDIRTNRLGQAGVVVTESLNICVDVKADNLGTMWTNQNPGVKRFFLVNPTTGGTTVCGGTTTPPGGTGNGNGNGTGGTPTTPPAASGVQSAASVVSLAGAPTPAAQTPKAKAAAKAAKAKLRSAKLLVLKGNRYLVLRLSSPNATAKVRIVLVNKKGKVQRVVIRKIATNRSVTVPNLRFAKTIKSVRVSVVA